MVVNATPAYQSAEKRYLLANGTEEKIAALKEMISLCPKHKGSENMLADLKRRLAKLKEDLRKEKEIRKRKGHSLSIKKEQDAQVVMIGFANCGKSSLLSKLTNATPVISQYPYTTSKPEIGTIDMGCKIQLVEVPSLKPNGDNRELLSIANTSDLVLILVTSLTELREIAKSIKDHQNKILVISKKDILDSNELKLLKNMKNSLAISIFDEESIESLKNLIFKRLSIIRIHTKEPGKKPTEVPLVLKKDSLIEDAAKKIRKDYVDRFVFARVWGKSAKFPGQKVGIKHILEDEDIIEIHLE